MQLSVRTTLKACAAAAAAAAAAVDTVTGHITGLLLQLADHTCLRGSQLYYMLYQVWWVHDNRKLQRQAQPL
jgi:hypothetical protein